MLLLYIFIILMLISALSLITYPFIKNRPRLSSGFFITSLFIIFSALLLYQFSGDKQALRQWLTHGEQHYQLQIQLDRLGGIDGIIERVKKKVQANPLDAQGWLILGKLYLMKHDETQAKAAFHQADKAKHMRDKTIKQSN